MFYISPARAHVTQTCPKAKRSSTIYKQAAAPRSESYRQTDTDYVNVIQCSAYDMNQVAGSQSVSQSVSQSHVSIGVVGRGRFVSTTDKKPRHRHNTCASDMYYMYVAEQQNTCGERRERERSLHFIPLIARPGGVKLLRGRRQAFARPG